MVSQAISQAFPQSISKRHGKKQQKYLSGIDIRHLDECEQPSLDSLVAENQELKARVQQLETRIAELEKRLGSREDLDSQMQRALEPSNAVYHGPNSIEHFESFSVDQLFEELRERAPDVFSLFSALARVDHHDENQDSSHLTQLRVLTSLCTLLKERSTKVLGIQLLITFMLVARATSKQVSLNQLGVIFYK